MNDSIEYRSIEEIREEIKSEKFLLSHHAYLRSIERNISIDEIVECADYLEIIEIYPTDKYSPSSLILGFTKGLRPLHIQITLDSSSILKIITVYEPDSINWINNYSKRFK